MENIQLDHNHHHPAYSIGTFEIVKGFLSYHGKTGNGESPIKYSKCARPTAPVG